METRPKCEPHWEVYNEALNRLDRRKSEAEESRAADDRVLEQVPPTVRSAAVSYLRVDGTLMGGRNPAG